MQFKPPKLLLLLILAMIVHFCAPNQGFNVYAQEAAAAVAVDSEDWGFVGDGVEIHKFSWYDYVVLGTAVFVDPDGSIDKSEVYVYELKADEIAGFYEILSNQILPKFESYKNLLKNVKLEPAESKLLNHLPLQWQIGLVEINDEEITNWYPSKLSDWKSVESAEDAIKNLVKFVDSNKNITDSDRNIWIGSNKPISDTSKIGNYWVSVNDWLSYAETNPSILWANMLVEEQAALE